MPPRLWLFTGSLLAGLAVALGALAAHGLDGFFQTLYAGQTRIVTGRELPAAVKYVADFKTAAEYQMTHALAILALGLWLRLPGLQPSASRLVSAAAWCFLSGILIFSGCLYALTLTGQRWLGAIVPIGGVLFIVGWALAALAALSTREKP
jgi:uncharacterized membrane protein YgdD (TMEM256/DUF423 family)